MEKLTFVHRLSTSLLTTAIFVGLGVSTAGAQEAVCDLHQESSNSLVGLCEGVAPRELALTRADSGSDTQWIGTLSDNSLTWPIEVASYEYADGPRLVLRTPLGWYLLAGSGFPDSLRWDISAEAPPSNRDLEILRAARDLISSEAVWDRADDRVCEPSDTTFSVYCAMARATRESMGRYEHRQPAMQIVRRVIADQWRDRFSDHRLMDFNNHPATTLRDIERLFQLAESQVKAQLE